MLSSRKKGKQNKGRIRMYLEKWNNILKDMRSQFKNKDFLARAKYASYWKHLKIKENQIVYESSYGFGMNCNPYAIFLALLDDSRAKDFQHIWVLDHPENYQLLIDQYKEYPNVSFIEYKSDEYRKILCTAKYLVNNFTFPSWFTKKEGQVYINTWHGIPLNPIGFDLPNGKTEFGNTIRNLLHADYLLSASSDLTNIYRSAFKLDNIFSGKIVEEGYPRLDLLSRFSKEDVINRLKQYGVEVNPNKKVLLYAPGWSGNKAKDARQRVSEYITFREMLQKHIDLNEFQVLIKVNQKIYQFCEKELTGGYFIPAFLETDEILSVTDVLITNFSNLYFDFLATNRPVLFYIKNPDKYRERKNRYRSLDQLPGPVTSDISELADWINHLDSTVAHLQNNYKKEQEWDGTVFDGQISKRIVDGIMFNDKDISLYTVPVEKKKILLSLGGGLRVNGVGTAFLNLLKNFDYDHYDISIMLVKSPDEAGQKLIDDIPHEVRVLYRVSTFNMSKWEYFQYKYHLRFGMKGVVDSPKFRREFIRIYGDAKFDYVLDFDGYIRFFALLCLQDKDAKTGIWLHNDMVSECEERYPALSEIFRMYPSFDSLISCSEQIMEVNREKLADSYHIEKDKFHYAKNFMDDSKFHSVINVDNRIKISDKTYICLSEKKSQWGVTLKTVPYYPDKDDEKRQNFRFVTVGRLSPEKNQLSLIKAFDHLHQENPNTYLYIIGDGPLKTEIKKTIHSLSSKDAIVLSGTIENPFIVMKYCDCFILPSLYEGEGMVVLEARLLRLPIIISEYDAVKSVSVEGGQFYIGTEVDDIYDGLKAYIEGKVPKDYKFDMAEYNQEAFKELLDAIR